MRASLGSRIFREKRSIIIALIVLAIGNGAFFDAQNAEQLKQAVRATLNPTYEVLRDGTPVATGTVNGATIELPVGRYLVRLRGSPPREIGSTTIEADGNAELRY